MQRNNIIILSTILGLFIIALFCSETTKEGLDVNVKTINNLKRGMYFDKTTNLMSSNSKYKVIIRDNQLRCMEGKKIIWTMSMSGKKILKFNENGVLLLQSSRIDKEPKILDSSSQGQILKLTAYGTLELHDENGSIVWGYNKSGVLKEGMSLIEGNTNAADTNLISLFASMDGSMNDPIAENTIHFLANDIDSNFADVTRNSPDTNWDDWKGSNNTDNNYNDTDYDTINTSISTSYDDRIDDDNDSIDNGHQQLLNQTRKTRRLRNVLDNKVKILNQLGDSHVTEKHLQLDSTIFISLVWTAAATSLIYFTFSH